MKACNAAMIATLLGFITVTVLVLIAVLAPKLWPGSDEEARLPSSDPSPLAKYHIGTITECGYDDDNSSVSWSCNETHFTTVRCKNFSNRAGPIIWPLDLFALEERSTSCESERVLRADICNVSQAVVFDPRSRAEVFTRMLETRRLGLCRFEEPVIAENMCVYSWQPSHEARRDVVREFACQPSEGNFSGSKVEVAVDGSRYEARVTCARALPQNRSCEDQLEIFLSVCANTTGMEDGQLMSHDPFEGFQFDKLWLGHSRRLRSGSKRPFQ
jgi:hypothetical protein